MKKFIAGLIVGIVMATALGGYAMTKVTGEYVNFNFLINGEKKVSDVTPVAINGRSYLPIRSIGDMLGLDVDYDGGTNTIMIDAPVASAPTTTTVNNTFKIYVNGVAVDSVESLPIVYENRVYVRIATIAAICDVPRNILGWDAELQESSFTCGSNSVRINGGGIFINNQMMSANGFITNQNVSWIPLQSFVEVMGWNYSGGLETVHITKN